MSEKTNANLLGAQVSPQNITSTQPYVHRALPDAELLSLQASWLGFSWQAVFAAFQRESTALWGWTECRGGG
jgi:hypothetical protein